MGTTTRETRNGKTLTSRTWDLIEDARKAAGIPKGAAYVLQGSFNRGGVAKSAGTHDGAGAFDLSVRGLSLAQQLRLIYHLRRRGVPSWIRSPQFGWPARLGGSHIHGIVRDDPGLSYGAAAQIRAYDAGRNGLASKARDPHPRPKWYPFEVVKRLDLFPGKGISPGDKGPAVKAIQRCLGLFQDGIYGPVTVKKVKAFQRLRPTLWPADGVIGPKTYEAIVKTVR